MLPSALEHTGAISSDDFAISMRLMALPHAFVAVATFGVVDSTEAIAFASEHLAGIDIAEGVGLILHQDSSSIGIGAHGLFLVLVAAFGSAAAVRNTGLDLSGDPCNQKIKDGWVFFATIAPH